MKKLLLASVALTGLSGVAMAEDVKLGVLLGFTGPIESIIPPMAAGVGLAVAEVTGHPNFLGGSAVTTVDGDTTCVDAAVATAAAERLIVAEGVNGVIGGDCSGVTGAVLQNVARPNGMVMISPSATSPALSTAEDDNLFFRTAPSDAREGQIAAEIMIERGITSAALTYTNNDYGKGIAEAIQTSFEALGGTITISASHEDGKADYAAEVGALAAAGGDILIVAGYLDQGGAGIIQAALDTGAFDTFELPGGMVGDSLAERFGTAIEGSYGQVPGSDSAGAAVFVEMMTAAGSDGASPYSGESYDAAALILLAMAQTGSSDPAVYGPAIMGIANGEGEAILPGELGKALDLIAAGTAINYEGATAVNLIGPGESAGRYREVEIVGGLFETLRFR